MNKDVKTSDSKHKCLSFNYKILKNPNKSYIFDNISIQDTSQMEPANQLARLIN